MRLDLYLVQSGQAASRTQARDLIENGYVFLLTASPVGAERRPLRKPALEVDEAALGTPGSAERIVVEDNELQKYVSRGGLKLEAALRRLNLEVRGLEALDMGQSTGGFTDCLLRAGAAKVVGVDVGHGQLHSSLRGRPQIAAIEGLHAKDLAAHEGFRRVTPPGGFGLIVADVSFISLTQVIPHLAPWLCPEGAYLLLVKPQFECGAQHLDKNGIVRDDAVRGQVEERIRRAALDSFGQVAEYFASEVTGKDGNQEFFIYGKKISSRD